MTPKDISDLITEMLSKLDIQNRYIIVSCSMVENCQSILYNGKPYILYNPVFLGSVRRLNFSQANLPGAVNDRDWSALTILAHEVGHHINFHLLNPPADKTLADLELEADRTAGHIISAMGASLQQVQLAYLDLPENAVSGYPTRQARLDAVATGWTDANRTNPNTTPQRNPAQIEADAAINREDYISAANSILNDLSQHPELAKTQEQIELRQEVAKLYFAANNFKSGYYRLRFNASDNDIWSIQQLVSLYEGRSLSFQIANRSFNISAESVVKNSVKSALTYAILGKKLGDPNLSNEYTVLSKMIFLRDTYSDAQEDDWITQVLKDKPYCFSHLCGGTREVSGNSTFYTLGLNLPNIVSEAKVQKGESGNCYVYVTMFSSSDRQEIAQAAEALKGIVIDDLNKLGVSFSLVSPGHYEPGGTGWQILKSYEFYYSGNQATCTFCADIKLNIRYTISGDNFSGKIILEFKAAQ